MIDRITIISPHIDDAVFSIGGILCNLKLRSPKIHISYIFSKSDWTNPNSIRPCTIEKDIRLVTRKRKEEEKIVQKALGYKCDFAGFFDWPIRDQRRMNFLKVKMDLYRYFTDKFTSGDILFFPIGVSHTDHFLIGEIGRILSEENFNIIYYEDLPYFARFSSVNKLQIYDQLFKWNLRPEVIPINIESKVKAVNCYETQISQDWLNDIVNYSFCASDSNYYERLWIPQEIHHELSSLLRVN